MSRLQGKTALVTGGGTGIGRGIALALAAEGCRVAIAGRREEKLKEVAEAYAGSPPLVYKSVDVGNRQSVVDLIAWAEQELGQIDILVNNAGTNVAKRKLAELSVEDWQLMMDVNANGPFYALQAVLPGMRARKDGLVVNISSVAGKRASLLGGIGYSASKFACTAMGMTAALEEAAHGIRITNIYPGEVETPILDRRPAPVSAERRATMLQPEDLGAAVVMIACLPPRAHVSELVIKPTVQEYV